MSQPVTQLLNRLGEGDAAARERLFELVYEELRALARAHLRAELGHTLQPTALVHEAYLKLVEVEDPSFDSRRHFYALASRVMRALLVDHARARNAQKRGGHAPVLPVDTQTPLPGGDDRAIALVDLGLALEDLSELDPELGQAAELRYLGGLAVAEIAATMQGSVRTTERRLQVATAWLRDRFDVT